MGDGSARRSAAAPGYLDDRAEPFDAAVELAFRDGDLSALTALDPDLARDLLASGRPAWQALAGALSPDPISISPPPTGPPRSPEHAPAAVSPVPDGPRSRAHGPRSTQCPRWGRHRRHLTPAPDGETRRTPKTEVL